MINIKEKILQNTNQEVLKNLVKNCEFEMWEKKNSKEKEISLDIFGEEEVIIELFEMEFDIELDNILNDLNVVYVSFNSVELTNLQNFLDKELKEVENEQENEKVLLDYERQNLEKLYREN